MWKVRKKDKKKLYQIYKDTKEHKECYSRDYFIELLERWFSVSEISQRVFNRTTKWKEAKPLTKNEFYRIDHLYSMWYERPFTLERLTGITAHRIKKYYFYNLK